MREDLDRGDARRQQVLQLLQGSERPVTVAVLAHRLGVHPNTVRFHLSALEGEERVERIPSAATGRGRPPAQYRAVREADHGDRRYELLASVLIESLGAGAHAREAATQAGRAWGRRHEQHAADEGARPIEHLVAYLGEAGFAPQRTEAQVVELHNCPFREVFEAQGDLVCAVHAGLMQGVLAGRRGGVIGAELEPLVRPGVCRVRMRATGAAA